MCSTSFPLQFSLIVRTAFAALLALSVSPVWAIDTIRYPVGPEEENRKRDYTTEMLKLAVQKSGAKVNLVAVHTNIPKKRMFIELQEGRLIDVYWAMTSIEREEKMLPIRICLMKGLMGWRIPLVTKKNAEMFTKVNSLAELQKLTAGQGYLWTDTQILLDAGIAVERSFEYESLFRMLVAGRFDYFPRSITEIWDEIDARPNLDMVADSHVVLHYPTGFYFFVSKNNPELAAIIRRGLENAIKDGSFNKLFYDFNGTYLQNAHLENRKVIELVNANLPEATPLGRKDLWFNVQDLKRPPR